MLATQLYVIIHVDKLI